MQQDHSSGMIPVFRGEHGLEFLLIQHHAGHWGFPKGHPEAGESDEQAATRELMEETGLRVARLVETPLQEQYEFVNRKGQPVRKTVTYFVAEVADQAVTQQPEEIADHAWGDAAQTRARMTFDEGRELFDRALVLCEDM